jgi:hypothetical protein
MEPIPQPELLDPERPMRRRGTRVREDDRPDIDVLRTALHETCAYARQLWADLDGVRSYLFASLPSDPRNPGPNPVACASPTGPDDQTGWENWITAYATVSSVLVGPQGDSGYGLSEARHEAEFRRSAPMLTLAPKLPKPPPQHDHDQPESSAQSTPPDRTVEPTGSKKVRTALTVGLVLLAIRGLRPRRRLTPSPRS